MAAKLLPVFSVIIVPLIARLIGYAVSVTEVDSTSKCTSEGSDPHCASMPSNSSCTIQEMYFKYTEDVDLLELEFKAMNYIEENVTNQYCRNYLKVALCMTLYPPCTGNTSVQRLCPGECDSLLNSSTCSSNTTNLVEYLSNQITNPFINFTINCSNSLSFANMFLNTSTCYDSTCISILNNSEVPSTCLQLDFLRQGFCSGFSLANNFYGYGYTSYANLSLFATLLEPLRVFFTDSLACTRLSAHFVCNYIFVPCDLFTGAPKPTCTDSCYFLRTHCDMSYFLVVMISALRFPIMDNCENTLSHLQLGFNFPCSSSSLGSDCVDLTSMFGFRNLNVIRTISITDITQSTCQVDFQTINNQPTTSIQLMTTPTNMITRNTTLIPPTNIIPMNDASSSSTDSTPLTIIVPSVVGGVLGLFVIFICILAFIIRNRKRQSGIKDGASTVQSVNSMFSRPSLQLQDGHKKDNNDTQPDNIRTYINLTALRRECGDLDKLLISSEDIEFKEVLGEGEFGCVYKGIWAQTTPENERIFDAVAVKTIKSGNENLKALVNECILMKKLKHPNVLPVLGMCLESSHENGLPFMIMPFMLNGDLKSYLKKKRNKPGQVDQLPEDLDQRDLLGMCYQIACGMSYLASKRFVHRDLAARNCMVNEYLQIKVADFGLARDVYMTDYYRQTTTGKIPAKWMAPEALHDRISNEKTDVWSYGITCWEVFSLGRTPYPTIPNHEILKHIDDGNRPSKPDLCPDTVYALMLKCWQARVDERLLFKDIVEMLDEEGGGYCRLNQ